MPERLHQTGAMIDPFDRRVTYLRLSVTDRCDLRCVYCMKEKMTFLPRAELLTFEELYRLATLFVTQGITKIRITGGEPLVRKDILKFISKLGQRLGDSGLKELTLTTNGTLLERYADSLWQAGIRRLNVSVDSLDPETYHRLTRRGRLQTVIDGLIAAKNRGFKIKINTVALKNLTLHELDQLLAFCHQHRFDITFIEVMPMGDLGNENRLDQFLPLSAIETPIIERYHAERLIGHSTGGPAYYYYLPTLGIRVGLISPLTGNFCDGCNRVRLTCTGRMYLCLGQQECVDFRQALRDHASNQQLIALIHQAIARKPKGHNFQINDPIAVDRHMSTTGG